LRRFRKLDPSRDRHFQEPGSLSPEWLTRLDHLRSIPLDSPHIGVFSCNEATHTNYVDKAYVAASECYRKTGVFPISFVAFPTPDLQTKEKTSLLSPLIPGAAYSFDHYQSYLQAYQSANFGVTHRKAGWDALRHSEIVASGCVPLMPDVEKIPTYSMTFYPKELMVQVAEEVRHRDVRPSEEISRAFYTARQQVLNTDFLANYILKLCPVANPRRVLFIDESLSSIPDYQSLMTLIGLKRRLGKDCAVYAPVPYTYDDCPEPSEPLYGRGFGYFRSLSSTLRSDHEQTVRRSSLAETLRETWDVIIIGNVVRNFQIAKFLEDTVSTTPTVWIDGEDDPPSQRLLRFYSRARPTVFVREWRETAAKSPS